MTQLVFCYFWTSPSLHGFDSWNQQIPKNLVTLILKKFVLWFLPHILCGTLNRNLDLCRSGFAWLFLFILFLPNFLYTVIQLCKRLGVKLVRNYNELNTSLDIKNNLGRNVLALFDPPHLSKLGKYFMCIQLKSTETSQNYKKSLFPNLNNIFVISRGILNRKKLTYFMEFCLLYSTSVNIKYYFSEKCSGILENFNRWKK